MANFKNFVFFVILLFLIFSKKTKLSTNCIRLYHLSQIWKGWEFGREEEMMRLCADVTIPGWPMAWRQVAVIGIGYQRAVGRNAISLVSTLWPVTSVRRYRAHRGPLHRANDPKQHVLLPSSVYSINRVKYRTRYVTGQCYALRLGYETVRLLQKHCIIYLYWNW